MYRQFFFHNTQQCNTYRLTFCVSFSSWKRNWTTRFNPRHVSCFSASSALQAASCNCCNTVDFSNCTLVLSAWYAVFPRIVNVSNPFVSLSTEMSIYSNAHFSSNTGKLIPTNFFVTTYLIISFSSCFPGTSYLVLLSYFPPPVTKVTDWLS